MDSIGQTHQYKGRNAGSGQWEATRISLTKRLEHWGGAADGKVNFPIEFIVLSVPQLVKDHQVGTVEYADLEAK